ncbi:MAG: NACHT domain-containing protein [Candidatus Omnitrophota bacterium]
MDPISGWAIGILTKLGASLIVSVGKKTGNAVRELFSEDDAQKILNQAFLEFKESAIIEGLADKDEKILVDVFERFFTDDRTIRELQLVFEAQSQAVDFELLDEIFVRICIDKKIDIPKFNSFNAILHVIKEIEKLIQREARFREIFQTAHLEKIYSCLQTRGAETNVTFARFKYLNQLIKHHNRLLFAGIPDLKEKRDIELPSIFVMPRVRESVPVEDYRELLREKQGDDEFTGEELQLRKMMRIKKEEEKEPAKFDKILEESANPRFVVLGKPGSGKSTLLKYLLLEKAHSHLENHRDADNFLFPILVEIRKFENALAKTNEPNYNILDFLYDSMRANYNLTLPDGFFEKYLDSGRALILFDGLDEVAAESRRIDIQQRIAAFAAGYPIGNIVIITSRIAGYNRAHFSTTDYRHFALEDFNDEEIDMFIHHWYRSRLTNENEADAKADELKNALEKRPRIRELARNPLLLTIIGIIHRYEAQLPEDRLVLYEKATEALLYTWDNVKDIIDEKFKLAYRRRFLSQTALHLQSLEKGDEAGTLIHRSELYKILLTDFCKIFKCEDWEAQELVDDFLKTIALRVGLLVEQAQDRYGFVHKTFQEYFAACKIANEASLKFDLKIVIDYVDRYIDNAFWHETLLLVLRALPNEQAQIVLENILAREDPKHIEPHFYHHHYFVMKFLAEQGSWLENPEFVKNQIDDFFNFSWNEGKDKSFYSNFVWKRFKNWVSSVSDPLVGSILAGKLLLLAEDETHDSDPRFSFAEALGYLGERDQALKILLHLGTDETHYGPLRLNCAEVLGNLGERDQAVKILLHLAEDETQDSFIRRSCAEALRKLGERDQAVKILLHLAEDKTNNVDIRLNCAEALGKLGEKDQAVKILLHLAEDETQDGYFWGSCAEVLGKLGERDQAVKILLHLAEDETQGGYIRGSCAEVLGKLGEKDQAVKVLLHLVEDKTQNIDNRRYCAEELGKLGEKDKAIDILINLYLSEKDKYSVDARRIYHYIWQLTAV